ncbi:hypothetical protein MNV49_000701 [Pseudohyphozyma bogoriensis]|nr:hypothetical protein MNV49_000701 [Pseudohyphozyma bogoriensis]
MEYNGASPNAGEQAVNGGGGLTFMAAGVVDFVISVTLATLLMREMPHARGYGMGETMRRLVRVSLQCGAYTTLSALIAAILTYAQADPWGYYYNIFSQPLAPLYQLALLTSLSYRQDLRDVVAETAAAVGIKRMTADEEVEMGSTKGDLKV